MVDYSGIAEIRDHLVSKGMEYLPKITMVVILVIVGFFVIKIIRKAISKFFDKVNFDRALETFIENVVGVTLWIVFLVIILANLGVDVTGLIAGLGIMGFIVGFDFMRKIRVFCFGNLVV